MINGLCNFVDEIFSSEATSLFSSHGPRGSENMTFFHLSRDHLTRHLGSRDDFAEVVLRLESRDCQL